MSGMYKGGDKGPEIPHLRLTGVYKNEAGKHLEWCATGTFKGEQVTLPESNLRAAFLQTDSMVFVRVSQLAKTGGRARQDRDIPMTQEDIRLALALIDKNAPEGRYYGSEPV